MLYLNKTRVTASRHAKLAAGQVLTDEGQALVLVDEGGEKSVRASTGAAGEKFYGFAQYERQFMKTLPEVIRVVATGAEQVIPLSTLVAGTGRAVPATGVTFQSNSVTIAATVANGTVIDIHFTKNATVAEVERLVGQTWLNTAVTAGAQVGCAQGGELYITNFDTSVAWAVGDAVNLGANGNVTKGGTGAAIPDALVISVPKAGEPYLGIELR